MRHRGRDIHTNPPPAAGGALLTQMLEALPDERYQADLVRAMASPKPLNRLGSTTHISVLDESGTACSVTTTNGAGSGLSIAGVHLNNMMGEEDLSPNGFFSHAPGDRLPSMMAPTVVTNQHGAELVLGSAGSSRICGAILQVLVNVLDRGMPAQDAVDAPRLHLGGDLLHVEPGDQAGKRTSGNPQRARRRLFPSAVAKLSSNERDPACSGVVEITAVATVCCRRGVRRCPHNGK